MSWKSDHVMWDFALQWTLQRWFKLSHSGKQESCSRVMVIANLHWCRHHLWHQDPVVTCQGLRVTQSWRVYDDVELVLILTISGNDGTCRLYNAMKYPKAASERSIATPTQWGTVLPSTWGRLPVLHHCQSAYKAARDEFPGGAQNVLLEQVKVFQI